MFKQLTVVTVSFFTGIKQKAISICSLSVLFLTGTLQISVGQGITANHSDLLFTSASASNAPRKLEVGDYVPDLELRKILNYKNEKGKISDFKGKIIILDFWATWCTSCIANFNKMETLQSEFGDKLRILLVNTKSTGDTEDKVSNFFGKWKRDKKKNLDLPTIMDPGEIATYFPHNTIPHYVWIDGAGKVLAITTSEQVKSENIEAVVNGKEMSLPQKKDILDYNADLPLFVDGNGGELRNLQYKTILTGRLEGIPQGVRKKTEDNKLISRYCITNYSVLQLYKEAFRMFRAKNRVLLDVEDKTKFLENYEKEGWAQANTYCYELITNPISLERVYRKLQNDLVDYFGAEGKWKTVKTTCVVLAAKKDNIKEPLPDISFNKIDRINQKNNIKTLSDLSFALDQISSVPIINMINTKPSISINLPEYINDIDVVRKILRAQGYDLFKEERELEMFVISDKMDNN